MKGLHVLRLGRVPYAKALDVQEALVSRRVAGNFPDVLLLLEHPHAYTLGRNFKPEHLLATEEYLSKAGIEVHEVDRGGSVTYHGPGQLVAYPIVSLTSDEDEADVVRYVRTLEEAIIKSVRPLGVLAQRRPGMTGVWVGESKLASIGVHVTRGVTKHGLAINVSTDLSFFEGMVPCGLDRVEMTTLQMLLARSVSLDDLGGAIAKELGALLYRRVVETDPEKLDVLDIPAIGDLGARTGDGDSIDARVLSFPSDTETTGDEGEEADRRVRSEDG